MRSFVSNQGDAITYSTCVFMRITSDTLVCTSQKAFFGEFSNANRHAILKILRIDTSAFPKLSQHFHKLVDVKLLALEPRNHIFAFVYQGDFAFDDLFRKLQIFKIDFSTFADFKLSLITY